MGEVAGSVPERCFRLVCSRLCAAAAMAVLILFLSAAEACLRGKAAPGAKTEGKTGAHLCKRGAPKWILRARRDRRRRGRGKGQRKTNEP